MGKISIAPQLPVASLGGAVVDRTLRFIELDAPFARLLAGLASGYTPCARS